MRSIFRNLLFLVAVLTFLTFTLEACRAPSDVDVELEGIPTSPSVETILVPTAEQPPPKTLIVCLNREPESLYLYSDEYLLGEAGREANAILQAIYDGPYDLVNYQVRPVILRDLPSLISGEDVVLEEVAISEGEVYLNPKTLQPELLQYGKSYLPLDCQEMGCAQTFQGGEVLMHRMVVNFHLKPELSWSDGEPLTAFDSVFSFELDRSSDTTMKYLVDRTYSYNATGEGLSVQWIGIPGFFDPEYATNFWSPLPEHILGDYTPSELLALEAANRPEIGWGPYVIEEWRTGEQVLLRRNPYYHRAAEGLPKFEYLLFRFLEDDMDTAIQQVLTGECDLLDESLVTYDSLPTILELAESGELKLIWEPAAEITRLDFNLAPVNVSFEKAMFTDVNTRRAIAGCIDRERLVNEVWYGMATTTDSFLSSIHPEYPDDLDPIPYDVEAATALLEQVGWHDDDANTETPRLARGVVGVSFDTPLAFTYLTSGGEIQTAVAERLQTDLRACGIEMAISYQTPEVIKADWPDGLVFGRQFQVVGWSWPDWITPLCDMFAEREIPSQETPFGFNASGFNHVEFNAACDMILLGLPNKVSYAAAIQKTQEIFASELPAIPIYIRPQVIVTANDICHVDLEPLALSVLWNLEDIDSGEACIE